MQTLVLDSEPADRCDSEHEARRSTSTGSRINAAISSAPRASIVTARPPYSVGASTVTPDSSTNTTRSGNQNTTSIDHCDCLVPVTRVSDHGEAAHSEQLPSKQPETGIVIHYHGCHNNECRTIRSGDLGDEPRHARNARRPLIIRAFNAAGHQT
jgi:hypothetical protein